MQLMDSKLNWSKHINFIKGKITKAIGIICKARKNLNRETLLVLYYSFVYPYLQYCIEVVPYRIGVVPQMYIFYPCSGYKKR